jgi:hypothetical protein
MLRLSFSPSLRWLSAGFCDRWRLKGQPLALSPAIYRWFPRLFFPGFPRSNPVMLHILRSLLVSLPGAAFDIHQTATTPFIPPPRD